MPQSKVISIVSDDEHARLMNEYKIHFDKIEEIVKQTGELLEGNCMYQHCTFNKLPELINKQRNLMTLARVTNRILEVGFNAGHSALCMLMANPSLYIYAIDICWHKYTKLCYDYLNKNFPGRIKFVANHSNAVLGVLEEPPFDVYHIDGGHDLNIANTDFFLIKQHAKNGAIVIWDDVDQQPLHQLWEGYKRDGYVQPFDILPTTVYPHAFGLIKNTDYKIAACSLAVGDNYKKIVRYGQKGKKLYCEKYGYDYFDDEDVYDTSRAPAWSKVNLILRYLRHPNAYDYVVWLDADTHIMNRDTSLLQLIKELCKDKDITFAQDWKMINTGVMFIKNTPWSREFFTTLYEQTDFLNSHDWEQSAIKHMYDTNILEAKTHINVLPLHLQNRINSYWFNYNYGDFLLHFPGCFRDGVSNGLGSSMDTYCPIKKDDESDESHLNRVHWLQYESKKYAEDRLQAYKATEGK